MADRSSRSPDHCRQRATRDCHVGRGNHALIELDLTELTDDACDCAATRRQGLDAQNARRNYYLPEIAEVRPEHIGHERVAEARYLSTREVQVQVIVQLVSR